jgi:hypothetical protein
MMPELPSTKPYRVRLLGTRRTEVIELSPGMFAGFVCVVCGAHFRSRKRESETFGSFSTGTGRRPVRSCTFHADDRLF